MAKILNHTINSGIAKDVLAELAEKELKDKYLGGGISLQFLLPQNYHRLTSDIDLDSPMQKPFHELKEEFSGYFCNLQNRGYNIQFSKEGCSYNCSLERDNSVLVVQMPRRSLKKHGELKQRLEKELSNSKRIQYAKGSLKIINPNDIIARKILRANLFHEEYNLQLPMDIESDRGVEIANIIKEELFKESFNKNPEEMAKKIAYVRMLSDISDIKAIIDCIPKEVDRRYIADSLRLSYPRDINKLESLLDEIGIKELPSEIPEVYLP